MENKQRLIFGETPAAVPPFIVPLDGHVWFNLELFKEQRLAMLVWDDDSYDWPAVDAVTARAMVRFFVESGMVSTEDVAAILGGRPC